MSRCKLNLIQTSLSLHRQILIALLSSTILSVCVQSNAAQSLPADVGEKGVKPAQTSTLTLEGLLQRAHEDHPQLRLSQAKKQSAQAQLEKRRSESGVLLALRLGLGVVEPPEYAVDQSRDDNHATLYVQKQIYDFGHTYEKLEESQFIFDSEKWRHQQSLNKHKLYLMKLFFDVLVADYAFIMENEAMSAAYVRFDKARDRNRLGQLSDVELLEKDFVYQEKRIAYYESQNRQRSSRSALANAMNQPGKLVSELQEPNDIELPKNLPDVEVLQERALNNNPKAKALRATVEAARHALQAARNQQWPKITARAEVSEYSHERGSNDRWRAALLLNMPLYDAGHNDALVSVKQAELVVAESQLKAYTYNLSYKVLIAWQSYMKLGVEQSANQALIEYRDLSLDRSRALYEMEFEASLGDAMVHVSEARLKVATTRFQLLLTLAELQAMLGEPVYPISKLFSDVPSESN